MLSSCWSNKDKISPGCNSTFHPLCQSKVEKIFKRSVALRFFFWQFKQNFDFFIRLTSQQVKNLKEKMDPHWCLGFRSNLEEKNKMKLFLCYFKGILHKQKGALWKTKLFQSCYFIVSDTVSDGHLLSVFSVTFTLPTWPSEIHSEN